MNATDCEYKLKSKIFIKIHVKQGIAIGVASLGPGGPGPPDYFKITITQTSRSAVYNTGKSKIGKNSVHKSFHKNLYIIFSNYFKIFFKFS